MRRRRIPRIFLTFLVVVTTVLAFGIAALLRISLSLGVDSKFFSFSSPTGDDEEAVNTKQLVLHPDRPWFMKGGLVRPRDPKNTRGPRPRLWPHEDPGDRIVEQLMYVPPGYDFLRNSTPVPLKKILLYFGQSGWSDLPLGRKVFQRDRCPVDTCTITTGHRNGEAADLVLFKDRFLRPNHRRSYKQIWLLFLLECPQHTQSFNHLSGLFNWTATYRHDSDIVAPYEKFVSYPDSIYTENTPQRNYADGKSRQVAWFVSNCAARNNRLKYARELGKKIGVDLYGKCGKYKCPRSRARQCFSMLNRDYKFYLAFENSNCRDYITEKFFVNGLGHDVLPIALGARPEDYRRSSPPNSYLHVEDFDGPEDLADYLNLLDKNDTLYNTYFKWKTTGEFINTRFWCRLCALLHAPVVPKVYTDLHSWWAGRGTCVTDEWRKSGA